MEVNMNWENQPQIEKGRLQMARIKISCVCVRNDKFFRKSQIYEEELRNEVVQGVNWSLSLKAGNDWLKSLLTYENQQKGYSGFLNRFSAVIVLPSL